MLLAPRSLARSAMINARFLAAVADAAKRPIAQVVAMAGAAQRRFAVVAGVVVGFDSGLRTDGVLALLADEGRIDSGLVQPLEEAARRRGLATEYVLVEEKLLGLDEVGPALERAAACAFRRAILTPGPVGVATDGVTRGAIRLRLAGLVLGEFRSLPLEDVRAFVGSGSGPLRLHNPVDLSSLGLQPAELRMARQSELVRTGRRPTDAELRLGGALMALGLASWAG